MREALDKHSRTNPKLAMSGDDAKRVFDLFLDGLSCTQIANRINADHTAVKHTVLKNWRRC